MAGRRHTIRMPARRLSWLLILGAWRIAAAGPDGNFSPEALEFFERSVRPVLAERCHSCHSHQSEKLKGNLYLDTREGALKGGDTGPAVRPGDLAGSLLIASIARTNEDLTMPPKTPLSPAEADALRRWVEMGAPWPREAPPAQAQAKAAFDIARRKAAHWCWQAVSNAAPPQVRASDWPRGPIDAFILARLEAKGLRPAPPADRRTLIRRAAFDLTGLPPTPAEVAAFVGDASPDAFATVVDRLLASPRFGERWARHWMDLVRYAESRGHEFDPDIPNAWQYRDYLVRAFNDDVPYDKFVREHLAGDLLPPRRRAGSDANESILATGFWFLGEEVHSPVDIRQDEADRLDNRLDVMGKTFLGLTLGCARCHDHKFDAISQRDYYALTGFLVSGGYRQARFESLDWNRSIAARLEASWSEDAPAAAAAAAAALRPWAAQGPAALLAAADAERGAPVETAAANRGAEVSAVQIWREAIVAAAGRPGNPLSRFAALTYGRGAPAAVEAAPPAPGAGGDAGVITDFERLKPAEWMQDGFTFGTRPRERGELLPGPDLERPFLGVAAYGAAVRDPVWRGLRMAGESRDYGPLGNWDRAEQTLKTREFRLGSGGLWYLVKGAGRAYAVVDSHLMVNGPLHGSLLREWAAPARGWAWVGQPLGDYRGHRLHVEFSPVGDADLEVARVVEADTAPPPPDAEAGREAPAGLEDEAREFQKRLLTILDAWAGGLRRPPADAVEAADWLAENFSLLCPPGGAERRRFEGAAGEIYRRRSRLAAQIRKTSACAPAMFDGGGIDEFVLARGSTRKPGALAPRRFLEALDGPEPMRIESGGGRLELAEAILRPSNPLTARVMVNRAWHHLFGRGIAATVDNLGVLGQAPTHPELLDHLAARFRGPLRWSLKALLREIMLSNAYQMASRSDDRAAEAADPENLLLHRMNLRRLEGEAIRDAILAVSGGLNPKEGGPSVPVYLTSFMEGRGRPAGGPLDGDGRRSLYVAVRRNFLSPMMLAFDAPIPFNTVGRRNVSNVPAQALTLMNDPFVAGQAQKWAQRLPSEPAAERVTRLFETAVGRPPTGAETAAMTEFVDAQRRRLGAGETADARAWADACHVVFNLKEFIYLD